MPDKQQLLDRTNLPPRSSSLGAGSPGGEVTAFEKPELGSSLAALEGMHRGKIFLPFLCEARPESALTMRLIWLR